MKYQLVIHQIASGAEPIFGVLQASYNDALFAVMGVAEDTTTTLAPIVAHTTAALKKHGAVQGWEAIDVNGNRAFLLGIRPAEDAS